MSLNQVCETASMTIPSSFDPMSDAEILHNALSKKGEEATITNIIGHRTAQMRLAIRRAYAERFNEDLLTVVTNTKLHGEYQDLLLSLLIGPIGMLARELRKKLDKETADEIICTANNWEIREIQAAYEALSTTEEFKKDTKSTTLEAAINKFKDPYHKDYLIRLLKASREELSLDSIRATLDAHGHCDSLIDMNRVEVDVRELHEAGEPPKNGKVNEDKFVSIICSRSNVHLKKIYDIFAQSYQTTLVDFIAKRLKSDVKNALNTSIMAAVDHKLLLTAQLYTSMSGLGTKESTLNRIICLRCEHDLGLLKVLYQERIAKDLGEHVHSEVSGEYRNLLLTLLNSTSVGSSSKK